MTLSDDFVHKMAPLFGSTDETTTEIPYTPSYLRTRVKAMSTLCRFFTQC